MTRRSAIAVVGLAAMAAACTPDGKIVFLDDTPEKQKACIESVMQQDNSIRAGTAAGQVSRMQSISLLNCRSDFKLAMAAISTPGSKKPASRQEWLI